jgi:hypothetical protein
MKSFVRVIIVAIAVGHQILFAFLLFSADGREVLCDLINEFFSAEIGFEIGKWPL